MCEDVQVIDLPTDGQLEEAVETFRLLGDPTRVLILWCLRVGEVAVGQLADRIGASPTAVSQHLAKLRAAGLVRARREGRHVHYVLADAHVAQLVEEALHSADHRVHALPDHVAAG